ncbi:MAG: P1 family peptidase, partial [Longimicrobiales bacterium]
VLPESLGGYTVGVLVQSNFGGILQIAGAPVGQELGQYAFANQVGQDEDYDPLADVQEWGSIMMVVATDAPLSDRNLERLARRAIMGLSRTGSYASNGSGDYVIAFSTATSVRRSTSGGVHPYDDLSNGNVSPLFEATVEATEEAILNSLFMAQTVTSNGRTVEALPIDRTLDVLRRFGVVR